MSTLDIIGTFTEGFPPLPADLQKYFDEDMSKLPELTTQTTSYQDKTYLFAKVFRCYCRYVDTDDFLVAQTKASEKIWSLCSGFALPTENVKAISTLILFSLPESRLRRMHTYVQSVFTPSNDASPCLEYQIYTKVKALRHIVTSLPLDKAFNSTNSLVQWNLRSLANTPLKKVGQTEISDLSPSKKEWHVLTINELQDVLIQGLREANLSFSRFIFYRRSLELKQAASSLLSAGKTDLFDEIKDLPPKFLSPEDTELSHLIARYKRLKQGMKECLSQDELVRLKRLQAYIDGS